MQEKTRDRHPPKGRGKGRGKGRRKNSPRPNDKGKNPLDATQRVLTKSSSLDPHGGDAKAPMTADEIREMKGHLRFLLKNRKRLQLKVNAKEDLLLNGAKEPTERGVCIHLLRKVDRNCVEKALQRIEDADSRIQLLQGVIGFSSDISLLILYLESLRETQSREKAAAALSLGLKRIDFEKASKAQMARVFDLISTLFAQESLPQLLFGFLQSQSFRDGFDHAVDRLPPALEELFMPIRALFTAVVEGQEPDDRAILRTGLTLFLASAIDTLKNLDETTRRRLFVLELALTETPDESDKTLQILLDTISAKDRLFSSLGLDWARQLLGRHEDTKAEKLLGHLAENHPRFEMPKRWLNALKQERIGRIALKKSEPENPVRRGFWIDHQCDVLVRIGSTEEQAFFQEQAQLHKSLKIPGIAPFATSGVSEEGLPYIATYTVGQSASNLYKKDPTVHLITDHLAEGLRLLWSLSQAGVGVDEFGVESCFMDSKERLWLQDLSQCKRCAAFEALKQNFRAAQAWCESQLNRIGPRRRPLFAKEKLHEAHDFDALMQWCQRLG
jgi:hypothetical protein